MKNLFLMLLLLVCTLDLFSQGKPIRVEFELESGGDNYYIIPLGKEGLLLFYEAGSQSGGIREWIFAQYDKEFKETWVKTEGIKYSFEFINYQSDLNNNKLYLLFSVVSKKHIGKGKDYMVITVDYVKRNITKSTSSSPLYFLISDFAVADNTAFVGGTSMYTFLESCAYQTCIAWVDLLTGRRNLPLKANLIYMDLKNETTGLIPYIAKGESTIVELTPDQNGKFMDVVYRNIKKGYNETYLDRYDANGNMVSSILLDPESSDVAILTAKVSDVGKDNRIIMGTYDRFKKLTSVNSVANGMYFVSLRGDKIEEFKLYNFADVKSFTKYLSTRSQKKVDKAKQKAEKKGKELQLSFNLLIHDPIVQNDEYIIITEVYYPEYETVCETRYVNGQPQMHCYRVFVGWRFTHAVIMAFDKKGNMLWDNMFEIQNILTMDLSKKIKVMFLDNEVVMIYSWGGYLNTKVIREGKVLEGKRSTKIETNYKEDKVKSTGGSSIEYWYDNYFLAYGFQRIVDKSKSGGSSKKRRTVFYLNKIEVE